MGKGLRMGCSADLSSDALLEVSGELIAYANPACERLLAGGAQPVPLAGRPFSEFFGDVRLDAACEAPLPLPARALDGGALSLVARAARAPDPGGYAVRLDSAASGEQQPSRAMADLVAKVFDLASDSILVVDHETMAYIYANKAVCAFHGLTREEFLALKPWDLTALMPRDDIIRLYDDLVAAAPEARSAVHTITSLKSGRTARALIQRQAIYIDGRWIVVLIGRDVTEIERKEARIERFSYALDQIGDGVLLIDYEASAFLDVNETACRMLGCSREELLARDPASVVDASREEMRRTYRQVVDQSPVTQTAENRVVRADGSKITCEVLRQAIKSGDRWVLVVTFRDITGQLEARARLQRLATALDLSSDYFMLLDHETMSYVDANEAACEFHGLTREQLRETRPWELTSPVLREEDIRRIHDEVVAAAPQPLRGVHTVTSLFSGRSVRMAIQRQAIRMEGRWMVVFIGRDITEIERNEARTKRFISALNQSPDGVFLVDYQTELLLDVNEAACTMLGYTREQMMRLPPISVIDAPKSEMRKIYRALLDRSPATQAAESRVIRADGSRITCEVLRQAIKSEDRWVLVVTLRDITEKKAAQARQAMLAGALDLSLDFMALVDRAQMRYLYVNQAGCGFHGLSREEYLATEPWKLYWGTREEMEATYDSVIAASPRALESTETLSSYRGGGRRTFLIQRQALMLDGRWIVMITGHDVTERQRQLARIERFARALDLSEDGVLLIDRETMRFLDVNEAACRMLGLPRDELMAARQPHESSPQFGTAEELAAVYDEVIRQAPATQVAEIDIHRADGTRMSCEVRRQAIFSDGRWIIAATLRDVTERNRTLARLKLFGTALDLGSDIVLLIDAETITYVGANKAVCDLHGLTLEEFLRVRPEDLNEPFLSREDMRRNYAELIACAPRALQSTLPTRSRKTGKLILLEVQRQAIRIEGRWIIVVRGRDITELQRNEARIERFATALDLSADAVFVIDRETLRYLDVNQTACRMLGYEREELLRIDARTPVPHYPDGALERIYDDVIAQSPAIQSAEIGLARSDGTRIDCEVWRQAIRSQDRWVIVITMRDITERKRAAVRQAMLASALDLGEDACFIVDRETMRYLDVNEAACRLLGSTRERLLAEWAPNQSSPELGSIGELAAAFDEAIRAAPATVVVHYSIHRADGTLIPCEVRRQAIFSGGRWIIAAIVRDISARVQAEAEIRQRVAELERSNRELEQFAYVTSHDLSEPLRMVGSYTQLLQRRYADRLDDDAREFMGFIVDGAQRMKRLIDDLLVYSRAGRGAARHEPLALDDALDDALANLAHTIGEAGATIRREPLPTILGERSGMVQVFQNLVGNAIKFRRPGAAVMVSVAARRTPQGWTVSVQDNGIGIEPRYFDRIFVIFQRLHSRGTYEGTGIGLAICRKVVERYGGHIEVRSVPGEGTTFLIHLPQALSPGGGEDRSSKESP